MIRDISTLRHDTSQRHIHKYENNNVLHRLVLGRFLDIVAEEIRIFREDSVLDFGCGEGFFWKAMEERGVFLDNVTGIDLREDALAKAREMLPKHCFTQQDLLKWFPEKKYDLVIAAEVLEHLPVPGLFLKKLVTMTRGHLLLTVPWEPFFRICNLLRGRDIFRLGNHPEHVNQWGIKKFFNFVSLYASVIKHIKAFPFQIVICRPYSGVSDSNKDLAID